MKFMCPYCRSMDNTWIRGVYTSSGEIEVYKCNGCKKEFVYDFKTQRIILEEDDDKDKRRQIY